MHEISGVDSSTPESVSASREDMLEVSLSLEEQHTMLEGESAKTAEASARTAVSEALLAMETGESKPPSYWEKVGNTLGGLGSMLNVRVPPYSFGYTMMMERGCGLC